MTISATQYEALYQMLDAALHSVSWAGHIMQEDPCDATIATYEQSLAYAAKVRASIGTLNDADMAERAARAGI
jgi:hypothetical protein